MRRRFVVCVFLLLMAACVSASAQDAKQLYTASHEQLEAVKVVLAQGAAWSRGDLDAYMALFKDAPDTEMILISPVRGIAAIRAALRINYPSREAMGTLDFEDVSARELGANFALASGKYHLERSKKAGGSADGTFTEILEKTPAGWRVIFSEST